jgi:hypothetical protein
MLMMPRLLILTLRTLSIDVRSIGPLSLGKKTKGGFQKSWTHGIKHRVHPNLGENAIG